MMVSRSSDQAYAAYCYEQGVEYGVAETNIPKWLMAACRSRSSAAKALHYLRPQQTPPYIANNAFSSRYYLLKAVVA